ncbi:glycosyltransferase family 2 protein [Vibrio cyclitrophicus]
MDLKPKVSICIVTYNQEEYIEETVMSAINQNVDFDYDILIGDDCSSDNTPKIVERLQKKYPKKIKLHLRCDNLGAAKNIIDLYKKATGEYIAHLDGDDLMGPNKLSLQTSILDQYENIFYCTHDVSIINNASEQTKSSYRRWPEGEHDLNKLLSQLPFFAHSSKVFRNKVPDSCWEYLSFDNMIDIEMHVEHAKLGLIYHIDKTLGSYRVFSGVSSINKQVNPLLPEATRRVFHKICHDRPNVNLKKNFAKAMLAYSYQSGLFHDKAMAKYYAKESFDAAYFSPLQIIFYLLSFFPSLLVTFIRSLKYLKELKVVVFR